MNWKSGGVNHILENVHDFTNELSFIVIQINLIIIITIKLVLEGGGLAVSSGQIVSGESQRPEKLLV